MPRKPAATEFDALEAACRRDSALLERFEGIVLEWQKAHEERFSAEFFRMIQPLIQAWGPQAKEWVQRAYPMRVMELLFAGGREAQRFRQSAAGRHLDPELAAWIAAFEDEPWRFSLFEVVCHEARETLRVRDLGDGSERRLVSRSVTDLHRKGVRSIFALLFPSGMAWQAFGVVTGFRSFGLDDFRYFASSVDPAVFRTGGLVAVVAAHPWQFLLLTRFAEAPSVSFRGQLMEYYHASQKAPGFTASSRDGVFQVQRKRGIACLRLPGEPVVPGTGTLYFEEKSAMLHLVADSRDQYDALVAASRLPWPADPPHHVGLGMLLAMRTLPGLQVPLLRLLEHFGMMPDSALDGPGEPDAGGGEVALGPLNRAMQEATEALNTGAVVDIPALAARHGLPVGELQRFWDHIAERFAALEYQPRHVLSGIPAIPPLVRGKMDDAVARCVLFGFADAVSVRERLEALLTAFSAMHRARLAKLRREQVSPDALPRLLDDLIDLEFPEAGRRTLFIHYLYCLRSRGREWGELRGFAGRLLADFWQLLHRAPAEADEPAAGALLIAFTTKILAPLGLIEQAGPLSAAAIASGACRVRASQLLVDWLTLRVSDSDEDPGSGSLLDADFFVNFVAAMDEDGFDEDPLEMLLDVLEYELYEDPGEALQALAEETSRDSDHDPETAGRYAEYYRFLQEALYTWRESHDAKDAGSARTDDCMKIAEAVLALTGEDAAGIRGLFLDKIDNALKLFCDACGVDLLRLGEEGYRREFLGNRLEEKGKELLGMLFSCRFSVDPHKGKATGKKGPGRPVKDTYSAETTLVVLLELLPLAGRWLWAAEE